MRSRRLPVAAATVCALGGLVLAGCGSTINATRVAGGGATQSTAGDGLGLDGLGVTPAPEASLGASPDDAGLGSEVLPSESASESESSSPDSSYDYGSGSSSGASVPQGFGVTKSAINIGIAYTPNGGAANAAILGAAIAQGDEKANSDAIIADINAKGGIAGRKVVPVYYPLDAQSSKPYSQLDQEMCAFFTQDHKVFAVNLDGVSKSNTFPECMKKRGITMISTGKIIDPDQVYFKQYRDYYLLSSISQDRMMTDQVKVLTRLKYFGGWDARLGRTNPALKAKVGVLYLNTPTWTRPLKSVLLPGLAKAGYPVAPSDQQAMPRPESTSDIAQLTAAVQAAVLRFRADNVTHVVVLDASGTMTLLFSTAAKNQGYLPRLGANTATGMQALHDSGTISNNQLAGAMGLGWIPSLDLTAGAAAKYETPSGKACLALLKAKTGQAFASANERSIALGDCEYFNFIKAVADKASVLTEPGFLASANALGTSYKSTGTLLTRITSGNHDLISAGYDMVWDTSCSCAKYVGEHTIP